MILLTGGSGLLGQELQKLREYVAPAHSKLDITRANEIILDKSVDLVVHAAAYTDVAAAEEHREACYRTNVLGTLRMAMLGKPMVYISTEYVFGGVFGGYNEERYPDPVNWYGYTKAMGEIACRAAPSSLIIRTLFKPRPYKHRTVPVDQFTTGDYVDVIAPMIDKAIGMFIDGRFQKHDTIHIGTKYKSTFELAQQTIKPDPIVRADIKSVKLPRDTSLNIQKWTALCRK